MNFFFSLVKNKKARTHTHIVNDFAGLFIPRGARLGYTILRDEEEEEEKKISLCIDFLSCLFCCFPGCCVWFPPATDGNWNNLNKKQAGEPLLHFI